MSVLVCMWSQTCVGVCVCGIKGNLSHLPQGCHPCSLRRHIAFALRSAIVVNCLASRVPEILLCLPPLPSSRFTSLHYYTQHCNINPRDQIWVLIVSKRVLYGPSQNYVIVLRYKNLEQNAMGQGENMDFAWHYLYFIMLYSLGIIFNNIYMNN